MNEVVVIAGTRPEVIKLAGLVPQLKRDGLNAKFVAIQQHHELLEDALDAFQVIDADVIKLKKHADPSEYMALASIPLAREIKEAKLVVVQGDTMTAMLGALLAVYSRKPVAHVEAGLRSGCLSEPWPEEGIRRAIDHMASIHLAPTRWARDNLGREGIKDSVTITGNTVADAVFTVVDTSIKPEQSDVVLVFLHRWENLSRIKPFLMDFLAQYPGEVCAITHPTTLHIINEVQREHRKLVVVEPMGYARMLDLIRTSKAIITDSGGVQEEASLLGIPCFVFRRHLDRPESVEIGQAKKIESGSEAALLLQDETLLKKMSFPSTVYGDGFASQRISRTIWTFLWTRA